MNTGLTKKFTRILASAVLLTTALTTYILWGEQSRRSIERTQSVDARLSELSRKLSVPVKVFDFASIHESIMGSTLINLTEKIEVVGLDGDILYSNSPSSGACLGNTMEKDVLYQNYQAGKLNICLKKAKFGGDGFFLIILMICTISLAFVVYIFVTGMRLTNQLSKVERFIKSIDPENPLSSTPANLRDDELRPIYASIQSLLNKIEESGNQIKELRVHEALSKEARSVAHDIMSPLSQMKVALRYETSLMPESKELLGDSISSIEKISKDLLNRYKEDELNTGNVENGSSLSSLWLRKKMEHMKTGIDFKENIQWDELDKIENPVGFKRALSNVINNAVEAFGDRVGRVSLETERREGRIFVKVSDDGPGIEKELIDILGKEEVTTKENGNGIGILNTKRYFDSIKGAFRVETSERGTTVFLEAPAL